MVKRLRHCHFTAVRVILNSGFQKKCRFHIGRK
nr:MAG TPA: hypothetical protein [Caudoviricetes sp.]